MPPTESRNRKIQYGHQAAILKMTSLKINRLLPIYISIRPLKFELDIQSQSKVRVWKPKKTNMAARQPFWKWRPWKSIGFCLWPPSTCIWNLKLKFQNKLDLCSGNHVVYRQTDRRTDGRTDGRTDKVNPVYPPSNFVGRRYKKIQTHRKQCISTDKHDDIIKWKHFPRTWPLGQRIHWSQVNSPHKGQWRGALMFSFIFA